MDLTPVALAAGTHTLLLAAGGQNQEMAFQGFVLDPGGSTQPVVDHPLIEFVGDSITANGGRIDSAKGSPDGPALSNYSALAAEALECDHVQVAFSGVALATGFGFFGDQTGFDAWYFRLKNCNHTTDNVPWDFSYAPRLVVINLGTNDMKDGKRPDDAAFAVTYAAFLRSIRARLPHAILVGMRPFGGFVAGGITGAVANLNAAGDRAVHAIDTTGWLVAADFSDGIHPTVAGHAKAAVRLTVGLRALLAEDVGK
jgi:lysophospholipase L1-like esterase